MQFSKLAFVAALAAVASAQTCSIADLPTCAVTPALQAIGSTGCAVTDLACVCKNQAFIASLTPAIQAGCSAADYQKAVTTAACLCAQAGVPLNLPSSSPSSSAAPATSASSAAPVSSAAPSTTVVATTSVAATTATTVAVVTTSASATTAAPKNATVTTSGPAVVTANAAAGHGSFVAAGLLGVGALLAAL